MIPYAFVGYMKVFTGKFGTTLKSMGLVEYLGYAVLLNLFKVF